jgi:hypothetical protein
VKRDEELYVRSLGRTDMAPISDPYIRRSLPPHAAAAMILHNLASMAREPAGHERQLASEAARLITAPDGSPTAILSPAADRLRREMLAEQESAPSSAHLAPASSTCNDEHVRKNARRARGAGGSRGGGRRDGGGGSGADARDRPAGGPGDGGEGA